MAARKKWQLRYRTTSAVDTFPSERKAYDFIQNLGRAYTANEGRMDPRVYVWHTDGVNGDGSTRWVRFEDVDLSEIAAVQSAGQPPKTDKEQ